MSGCSPPYSVTLSFDDQENDDRSEVSWSSGADGNSLTQGFSIARLIGGDPSSSTPNDGDNALLDESDIEQATNSSRGQQSGQHNQLLSQSAHQLSHNTHSAHQLSHSAHQLSSSRHTNGDHQTLSDTYSRQERLQKQILHLERKGAKQKEKLDILSTTLRQSNAEKDVLKAEKASLIDELALARETDESQSNSSSKKGFTRRLSIPGFTSGGNRGGSMQMLLDTNAKLMNENARLQVSEESIRKSFQSHVRYCNRLHQRNEMLQQQLSASKNVRLSMSEHTGRTAFSRSLSDSDSRDDFIMPVNIGSSQHSEAQDSMLMNSLHSIPEKQDLMLETTDDDWSEEGGEIDDHEKGRNGNSKRKYGPRRSNTFPNPKSNEYTPAKILPRSKSNEALLVEFGNVETRRGRSQSSNASWAPQSSGAALLSASNHSLDVSYSESHHYQDEYHHHEEDLPLHDISQHSAPEMMSRTPRTRGGASWSSGLALGTRMFKKNLPSEQKVNPNPCYGNRYEYTDYEYKDNDTNNMPLHDASQHSHHTNNRGMMDSLHSIPEKVNLEFGSSYEDDEWTVEDKELEEDLDSIEGGANGNNCRSSRHNTTNISATAYRSSRRSTVPPAGVSTEMNPSTAKAKGLVRRKTGPLLVDFGELGRSRSGDNDDDDDDVDHHGDYDGDGGGGGDGEATASTIGGLRRTRSETPSSRLKNPMKKGGWSSLMGLNRSERSGVSQHVK